MILNLSELGSYLQAIIDKSKMNGLKQIEIKDDLYWNLPPEESFNLCNSTPQITVGSIIDDYDCIKQMMQENTVTPVDFERLAHLLLVIAYSIESSNKPFIS